MYEDDTPAAERRAQALSLDRELLRELLGQDELRDLLDPDALAEVEASLRPRPRNADELHDLLRRGGDLRDGELDAGFCETLLRERRALRVRIGGRRAGDRGRGRRALPRRARRDAARRAARGVPRRRSRTRWSASLLRFARSHGPFTTAELAGAVRARPSSAVEALLAGLERRDLLVRGELRPGGTRARVVRPRRAAAHPPRLARALRREVEPAEQVALGRFLPAWHGIDRRATLREALVPLQGVALPVSLWESEVLPRRVPGYQPAWLDELCASGEVVWVGAGLDRVALFYREDAAVLGPPATSEPPEGEAAAAIRAALARSAEFWLDLLDATGLEAAEALPGAVGARLGRRGHERRVGAAARRAALRRPAGRDRRPRRFSRSRASAQTRDRGPLVARRRASSARPGACPTGARSRSSCSSGRGS